MAIAGLSIRLYLDHNVHPWLADDVRTEGYDVVVARDLGHQRFEDEEHLRWASAAGRAVVTFDVKDYPVIARRWAAEARDHAGIILAVAPPVLPYGTLLRRLFALLDAITAEEMVNQVRWLDPTWDIGQQEGTGGEPIDSR